VILVENANVSYRPSINLHDPLQPLDFFLKFLTQTVRVPALLDGAKILLKTLRSPILRSEGERNLATSMVSE